MPFKKNVCSSVLELFLSNDVLNCHSVSCFVWNPGKVAAAFATANGDPNKIPNVSEWPSYSS
jgi:hypothetical protein